MGARADAHPREPDRDARRRRSASGLLSTAALATFDWRLAVGDVDLGEEELRELAAAKSAGRAVARPLARAAPVGVERALQFLERRKAGGGVVDLVRAVSGIETDEAGLEMGEVTLDPSLAELLERRRALPAAAGADRR